MVFSIPPQPARVGLRKNGSLVGKRGNVNVLDTTGGITWTTADDAANDESELTAVLPTVRRVWVTGSGAQTVSNDTDATLSANTEGTDTHNFWVIGSPTRLTVPTGEGGDYTPEVYASFAADADGYRMIQVLKNGSPVADHLIRIPATPTLATVISVAFPALTLSAADYLEFRVRHTAGASLDVEAGFGFGMTRVAASSGTTNTADHNHTSAGGDGGKLSNPEFDGYLLLEQIATPSTPASGKAAIFAGTDDTVKVINDSGNVTSIGASDVTRLAETIVGVGGVASVTLSGISGSYRALRVVWAARTSNGSAQGISVQMNSDTGANYDVEDVYGNGTTVAAEQAIGGTSARIGTIQGSGAPANGFAQGEFTIWNYARTTMYKLFGGLSMRIDTHSSGGLTMMTFVGQWRSTSAITSITFTPAAGNLVQDSVFTLYGIS